MSMFLKELFFPIFIQVTVALLFSTDLFKKWLHSFLVMPDRVSGTYSC